MPAQLMSKPSIRRPLPSILAKTAVVAAPLAAAALFAPAQATTLQRTFTGFSGAFAPNQWTKNVVNDGTGTLTSTTMTIKATDANPNGGGAQYTFTPSSRLDSFADPAWPAPVGNQYYEFVSGTASFSWNWVWPTGQANGNTYPLQTFVGSNTPETLWTFNGSTIGELSDYSKYTTSGTASFNVSTPDGFGFRMFGNTGGNFQADATATITNFQFVANYRLVPGPLPAAAAVAGFAWSRRLRRRLQAAGAQA